MKKLGLITYAYPHLKTEQVLLRLLNRFQPNDIIVFALPFIPREKRKVNFNHRPDQICGIDAKIICEAYGIEYRLCENDYDITNDCEIFLVTGAGVLSREMLEGKKVINAHPGIIPAARGLDSFKWSIYNDIPLGITLHYIDQNIDMGEIISIVATPIFKTDTLETVARRHYENEITALVSFDDFLQKPCNSFCEIAMRESTRRMPFEIETEMARRFDGYKERILNGGIFMHQ